MKPIEIPFSSSIKDQRCLALVGGWMTIKANDDVVFCFKNEEVYKHYLVLKDMQKEKLNTKNG